MSKAKKSMWKLIQWEHYEVNKLNRVEWYPLEWESTYKSTKSCAVVSASFKIVYINCHEKNPFLKLSFMLLIISWLLGTFK